MSPLPEFPPPPPPLLSLSLYIHSLELRLLNSLSRSLARSLARSVLLSLLLSPPLSLSLLSSSHPLSTSSVPYLRSS